jgi:hypothetical protein
MAGSRGAWSRQQVVEGVSRLDAGAVLDARFHRLHAPGVADWLTAVQGAALQRVMGPFVPYLLLDRLKTWFGMARRHALPALLGSAEACMRLGGFKAPQGRPGVCQRGAATRQGPRPTGPLGPEAWPSTSSSGAGALSRPGARGASTPRRRLGSCPPRSPG